MVVGGNNNCFGGISEAVRRSTSRVYRSFSFLCCTAPINWVQFSGLLHRTKAILLAVPDSQSSYFQVLCISEILSARLMEFPTRVSLSKEDYKAFHKIDRKLYALLVTELWREPVEAMKVMAIWLWMEHIGFYDVVKKIVSLPPILINELYDEALACHKSIHAQLLLSTEATDIPLTQALVGKMLSLSFFYDNRSKAREGLETVNEHICAKALVDIMNEALERNAAHLALVQGIARLGIGAEPVGERSQEVNGLHPDNRTMFVTFSKGYPVAEWEVRDFFHSIFGDCIESFYMQEVPPEEQALFARIVFFDPSFIDIILNGVTKAKFTINGKHVWMRKFVPKSTRIPPLT